MNVPGRCKSTYIWLNILFIMTMFSVSAPPLAAQPVLSFMRVVNNWPTIELYFKVSCNGKPEYNFNKDHNFSIRENGREIESFSLWCPDARIRCAVSIGFVVDCSGALTTEHSDKVKSAVNNFMDLMDGLVDEAAILCYSDSVRLALGMTTNLTDLHSAVNALTSDGRSSVWDGIYEGLRELYNRGNNPCRAIIAVVGTKDNYSIHTPQDVVSYAESQRIRIYTIGVGADIHASQLQMIAAITGGDFYQYPGPNDMARIYQDISQFRLSGFLECLITYQSRCMDGAQRLVELELKNYCNGVDSGMKSYRAPRDTSTYTPLELAIGNATGAGNQDVVVPLQLRSPLRRETEILPAVFEVLYETQDLEFLSLETTGTLFEGIPLKLDDHDGQLRISSDDSYVINQNGDLFRMRFKLNDPDDTTCTALMFAHCSFQGGCYNPIVVDGEVCITPRSPRAVCTIRCPDTLSWNAVLSNYEPKPAIVQGLVFNTGDKALQNARFTIQYDASVLQLMSPYTETQWGSPIEIAPSGMSQASWIVRAKPSVHGDSTRVTVSMEFDNHKTIDGACLIHISPAGPTNRIGDGWPDSSAAAVGGTPHAGTLPKAVTPKARAAPRYSLAQNHPNPFNPGTSIEYSLAHDAYTKIEVLDILGRPVKTLVNDYQSAGTHRVQFHAGELRSGIYLYKLETNEYSTVKRMIISR